MAGVKRGFASMSSAELRRVSSKGGMIASERGTAYRWTSEKAAAAGRKSGVSRRKKRGENPEV